MEWEKFNNLYDKRWDDMNIRAVDLATGGGGGNSQGGYRRQPREQAPLQDAADELYEIVDDVVLSEDEAEAEEEETASARHLVNNLVKVSVNTSMLAFLVCEGWHALASAEPVPAPQPRRRLRFQGALPFTPVEMVADRFVPSAA